MLRRGGGVSFMCVHFLFLPGESLPAVNPAHSSNGAEKDEAGSKM